MNYPWLLPPLQQLMSLRDRMPHALLIQGRAGTGKLALARELVAGLLCEHRSGKLACGECDACRWFAAGNHPDFMQVGPPEDDAAEKQRQKPINVDQVRAASRFLQLSSHRGGLRVVLLQPAEGMNPAAANALLKTLEEPPDRTLLVLVSHHPARLLPTVISRCHQVRVPIPSRDIAQQWLQAQGVAQPELCLDLCSGAPLRALEQADSALMQTRGQWLVYWQEPRREHPVKLAAELAKMDTDTLVRWLTGFQQWLHDLISVRMANRIGYHTDCGLALQSLAQQVNVDAAFAFHQRLLDTRKTIYHTLNQQMMLEDILLAYADLF